MSNFSECGSNLTPSSCQTARQAPRKNDRQSQGHQRAVSRSTAASTEPRHSEIISESNREYDSQTDISIHDQEYRDDFEGESRSRGIPSPQSDPFLYPVEERSHLNIEQDFDQEIEALGKNTSLSREDQHPDAVGILRLALDNDPSQLNLHIPPDDSSQSKSLIDRLFLAAVRSCGPDSPRRDESFYPPSVLIRVLDISTVRKELHQSTRLSSMGIERLAKLICTEHPRCLPSDTTAVRSYRAIFALLVLVERLEWIQDFIDDKVSNLDLPLTSVLYKDGNLRTLRRKNSSDDTVLSCFRKWPLRKLKDFSDLQWQFIAHNFRRSEYNDVVTDDLNEMRVLPFIKPIANCGCPSSEGVVSLGEGGSGLVMRCFIHPDFHDFPDPDGIRRRGVAVKRLKMSTSDAVFQRELKILGRFCGHGANDHVVSLLGTYKQSGYHHLVFPRAEMNLFEYWKQSRTPPVLGYDGMVWVAKQCAGLTEALYQVHKHKSFLIPVDMQQASHHNSEGSSMPRVSVAKAGRSRKNHASKSARSRPYDEVTVEGLHGDVKPENLLLFLTGFSGDRGVIKLSDFGEAEMTPSARGSRSRTNAAVTLTYRAPECDLRPDSVRPASDVWSLGCVFLEFITWVLGGHDYVSQFALKRLKDDIFYDMVSDTFFELATSVTEGQLRLGLRVKPEVANFIEELHTHKNCTNFLHELLDVVQDRMLLVDPTHRKCDFKARLETLHRKCQNDRLYATEPRPRKRASHQNTLIELRCGDVDEKLSGKINFNMHRIRKHHEPTRRSERGREGAAMWKFRVMSI